MRSLENLCNHISNKNLSRPECHRRLQYIPTLIPTCSPTYSPTYMPTYIPACAPSLSPTYLPTSQPSSQPSLQPSRQPSCYPSRQPTRRSTTNPSSRPIYLPTSHPSTVDVTPLSVPSYFSTSPIQTPIPVSVVDESVRMRSILISQLLASDANESMNSTNSGRTKIFKTSSFNLTVYLAPATKISTISNAATFVFLPIANSGNTINLALVATSYNNSIIIASATEFSSRVFAFNASSMAKTNETVKILSLPVLVSSLVTIQVAKLNSNGALSPLNLPYFEVNLKLSGIAAVGDSMQLGLVHNCTVGIEETISVLCVESNIRINLTCSGRRSVNVHRRCPASKTVCSILNVVKNTIASNDYCQTETVGSSVLCKCGEQTGQSNGTSQPLFGLDDKVSVSLLFSGIINCVDGH